jgi:DNA-directed RNA polymerase subunit E'/Rpb7
LSSFLQEKIVEIPGKKKQYTNLYFKSWAWKMKGDEYKLLLDTTEEIYDKIKDIDFKKLDNKKAQVLETCKRDYEDHRKYINPVSLEGGISAFLIKKPYQE